jgi:hypothetical protein
MRRAALAVLVVLATAGCGGSGSGSKPEFAYLTGVRITGDRIRFDFRSQPDTVSTGWVQAAQIAECGSGKPVRVRGTAFVVVHFQPAATAEIHGDTVSPTYTGAKRVSGAGPVLEAAKSCDFEADLGWAIGLSKRLPIHLDRDGSSVTVRFG